MIVQRRRFLMTSGAGLAMLPILVRPARATPDAVAEKIREVVGEAEPKAGRIKLDIPLMVENGNSVPITVTLDAPMTGPARAESLHVFAEGNPLPNVAHFTFGPRAGKAQVQTRIRLATSQTVIAIGKLADGSCWRDSVELMVTLAACIEGT